MKWSEMECDEEKSISEEITADQEPDNVMKCPVSGLIGKDSAK
jgi:hypothetical protein